ncbi:MAG: hypothetical protein U0401_26835, partial [Anaerolineae bacterium]
WAIVNELSGGRYHRVTTLQHLAEAECSWWLSILNQQDDLRRWLAHKRGRACYWSPLLAYDFFYLYDLEAELWGANLHQFLDHTRANELALEPFRFVLLFYLTERALKLWLAHLGFFDYEQTSLSHARLRDLTYAQLFEQARLGRWFPFPFNLTALSKRMVHGQADYTRHLSYTFAGSHFGVVRQSHYASVLASALTQAVSWQRQRRTDQGHPPAAGSLQAFFFDPLWRYSESYRYRLPLVGDYLRHNPFYWGLNLRWLGSSLLELLELWLYSLSAQRMRSLWQEYARQSRSPALAAIQQPRWQALQAAAPQRVIA